MTDPPPTLLNSECLPGSVLSTDAVRVRYECALSALVDTLKQDRTILAAILCGSLAYDEVWDKSDIDLVIIGDESHKQHNFCLVEGGINIHAMLTPRSHFKKSIESTLQSSFLHSYISKGRLLFAIDESLGATLSDLGRIGERDREIQMFRAGCNALPLLAKAEKWFHIRGDLRYSFAWILHCVKELAIIEVISQRQITGREVIQQALALNPLFFGFIYTDLIDGPKDRPAIGSALDRIELYLVERSDQLFGMLLKFLAGAGGPRSMTEIESAFHDLVQGPHFACEWLADRGVIEKVGTPLRLSPKSRVAVNEAAFYYDDSGD